MAEFKYESDYEANQNDGVLTDSREFDNKDNPFFSKPHPTILDILIGHRIQLTAGRHNEKDEMVDKRNYDIVVWNLSVKNRFEKTSHVAKDCIARIYWDFIEEEGQLLWKTPKDEPNECVIPVNPTPVKHPAPHYENRYDKVLGDDYVTKLKLIAGPSATLSQGKSREMYFLLTIKGHDVAYPIVKVLEGSNYGSNNTRGIVIQTIHDIPLFIPIKEKYTFGIRFDSIGYTEERDRKYRLDIESYDKVDIVEV